MSSEFITVLGLGDGHDKKSAAFLSSALAKNVSKEFDYMKYRQALNALHALNLDEATSFKSAYATATSMGVTKSSLINSAKQYLSVLMNEKSQFDAALNHQIKERVGSKRDEVVKLQQKIEEMRHKIRELEHRINEFQRKIDSADDDVGEAKQKILETKEKFESTFQAFVDAITRDIERMNEYL